MQKRYLVDGKAFKAARAAAGFRRQGEAVVAFNAMPISLKISQTTLCRIETGKMTSAYLGLVDLFARLYSTTRERLLKAGQDFSGAAPFEFSEQEVRDEPKQSAKHGPKADDRPRIVVPVVYFKDDAAYAMSTDVAAAFGKDHKHVLRDIQALLNNEATRDFARSNFGPCEYLADNSRMEPAFRMRRDGFMLLVMGFNGEDADRIKVAYIQEFSRKEKENRVLREQAATAAPSFAPILEMMGQIVAQNALFIRTMTTEFASVRAASSPEKIEAAVKQNLAARAIAGVPESHISAAGLLKENYVYAIGQNVIGRMLKHAGQTRDEFEIIDGQGDMHLTHLFRREGLEDGLKRVFATIRFERETLQRIYFSSVLNHSSGVQKEFCVPKEALFLSRPAMRFWAGLMPTEVATKLEQDSNVVHLRRKSNGDMAVDD